MAAFHSCPPTVVCCYCVPHQEWLHFSAGGGNDNLGGESLYKWDDDIIVELNWQWTLIGVQKVNLFSFVTQFCSACVGWIQTPPEMLLLWIFLSSFADQRGGNDSVKLIKGLRNIQQEAQRQLVLCSECWVSVTFPSSIECAVWTYIRERSGVMSWIQGGWACSCRSGLIHLIANKALSYGAHLPHLSNMGPNNVLLIFSPLCVLFLVSSRILAFRGKN